MLLQEIYVDHVEYLMAGMSIEDSSTGRKSNLFKHNMIEMQQRGLIQPHLFKY